MAQYYYLISGLPELDIEQTKLPIQLADLKHELENNLYTEDYQLANYILLAYDNQNLINLIQGKDAPHEEKGLFTHDFLEEVLKTQEIAPFEEPQTFEDYIRGFVVSYKNDFSLYPGMRWEDQLTNYYYDFVRRISGNEFLCNWFDFDMNLTNMVAAFNARNHSLPLENVLVGDNDVTTAITATKAKDFGLSQEYEYINTLVNAYDNENLYNREKQIDILRWKRLERLTDLNYFSVEVVLVYLLKLQILDRWVKLDKESGEAAFKNILDHLQSNYEFPKEFL